MRWWKSVVLGLLLLGAPPVRAQSLQPAVIIESLVRDSLAKIWDDTNPQQVERGYCLAADMDTVSGVPVVYVRHFVPPDSIHAETPYSIAFYCPNGSVGLHVHTPTTCATSVMSINYKTCRMGGADAYECYASWPDVIHLTALGQPVGFIQCSRHAIIIFFPLAH